MQTHSFCSVYGPVKSWRFGRSLGIDPIGAVSTCNFNCVYCQLGQVEKEGCQRQIFISTEQIISDLAKFDSSQAQHPSSDVNVVTVSGSGEPTLALNLGDILKVLQQRYSCPIGVLTNSTLLGDPEVQMALASADRVAAKLDAISFEQLRRINRPLPGVDLDHILTGLIDFRHHYRGHLAVQTMVLVDWSESELENYCWILKQIGPQEIQLNVPSRPRILIRQIESRGNELTDPFAALCRLTCVSAEVLHRLVQRIQEATQIPVHCYPAS